MSAFAGHVNRANRRHLPMFVGVLLPVLLLLGASLLAPVSAAAETDLMAAQIKVAADSDVTWTYVMDLSGDATITGYTLGDGVTQISIPESIDEHRVGAVANEVFSGDTRLTRVTFPATVVRLGERLFENCTSLTYVDLTAIEELDEIPFSCFQGCTALTSVDIPASVTRVMGEAFYGCTSLKQVNIPPAGKLDRIGISAFRNCESLESLDFPASLSVIELHAFDNCKNVASIRFRGSEISLINGSAFKGCAALEELYLPDRMSGLGSQAFANCASLKLVSYGKELPRSTLPSDLFEGCNAIELMIFPLEMNDKGEYQEISDTNKTAAGWKKGVTATLHTIYNDDDDVLIGYIHATKSHGSISLPSKIGNHDIVAIAEFAAYADTALTELVFPDDCKITTIMHDAFKNCTSLRAITIPSSVERIETGVFNGCTSLSSATFDTQKLATLGGATFMGCTSLESITLPEGMTTLYPREFYNCTNLKDVYLPNTMTDIETDAFGCDEGKHMAIEAMRMPDSADDFKLPSDVDFFESWIVNLARDTFKFKVTYGSTADFIWFEPHILGDPQLYPIMLPASDREYVPVAIGDGETHLQEANDVKLIWSSVENWTGEQIIPQVTATRWYRTAPVDSPHLTVAPVEGDDCTSVGVHHVKVTGNAPYFTGYRILEFEIVASNMDDVEMGTIDPPCVWDNAKWEPDPDFYVDRSAYGFLQDPANGGDGTYTLVRDKDYKITEYEHNKLAGKATIWIQGMGNFKGKKSFPFTIAPAEMKADTVQVEVADQLYTGEAITPVPSKVMLLDRGGKKYTVKLDEGVDYTVDPDSYQNNTNVGTATMKLVPVQGCTWLTDDSEVVVSFNIVQADLSKATIQAVPDQVYTGSDITPALKVSTGQGELTQDVDYTVSWKDNRDVGTAKATIKAKSAGCKGEKTIEFEITKKACAITVNNASKAQGEADPVFTGTVEGLVAAGDLGTIRYVRTNSDEDQGVYKGVLSAEYRENPNYAVTVTKGDFTITKPNYSVRFDANVPASASTACSGSMDDQRFAYSEKKALSANAYSLPGYDFAGWNTRVDGTGTAFANGEEVQGLSEDGGAFTLYAQWSAKSYTIVFNNPDDASSHEHTQTAYFDQPGTLDVYSDAAFGWSSGGKTLHGWAGTGFGSFYGDGADFINLCGAPRSDGSLANREFVAQWISGGEIIVTVAKDDVPQAELANYLLLTQGDVTFKVPISYERGAYVFNPAAVVVPGGLAAQLPEGDYDLQFAASGYPKATVRIEYGDTSAASVVLAYYTVSLSKDPAYADFNDVEISGGEPVTGRDNTVIALDDSALSIKTTVDSSYRFDGYTAVGVAPAWEGDDPSKAEQSIKVQGQAAIAAHVSPKPRLVITPVPQNAVYNGQVQGEGDTVYEDPAEIAEKVSVEGLREGDMLASVVLDGQGQDAGEHEIVASNASVVNASGDIVTDDYAVVYMPGTLAIEPAKATVATGSASKTYDGKSLASAEATIDGLVGGEAAIVTATGSQTSAGSSTNAYSIEWGATKEDNYDVMENLGTLTVEPAKAMIAVDDAFKVQGETDPTFTGTVEGLVARGDLGDVRYFRTNNDEEAGVYKGVLDAEYAANPNYDVSVERGDFTIKAAYTRRWLDGDGSVLQEKTYAEGEPAPAYDGNVPTKAATAQYTYEFVGWDDGTVRGTTTTYKPLFSETINRYKVTFVDYDGTSVLKEATEYDYGTLAADIAKPADPTRKADKEYTYVFAGWMPEVADVTADAVYTAVYESGKRSYEITWLQDDGTLIDKTTVEYGVKPEHADPSKAATERYTYKFKGWEPAVAAVTGDATYTATYTETPVPNPTKKGTLTFDLAGGTINGKKSLVIEADVGDVIIIPKAPVRDGYTFKYWKGSQYYPGDKYTVKGDHAFTAVWEKKPNSGGGGGGANGGGTPKTGDALGGTAAPLAIAAAGALCLAVFALRQQRRRTSIR